MSSDVSSVRAATSPATDPPQRRAVRRILIALVLLVTLALFVLAFLGITERETYAFARQYGTPVEASLPGSCVVVTNMRAGKAWKDCGATWSVGGTEVEGKLLAGTQDELIEPIDAFAVKRTAFTAGYPATGSSDIRIGLVPAWLFLPFPVTVIALIAGYRKRISRWASNDS